MTRQHACVWHAPGEAFADCAAIRQEVFVEEQGFHNELDEIDAVAWHLCLYIGGEPAAVGRIFPEDDGERAGGWHLGRLAVRKAFRGGGTGREMMGLLEQKAKELGAKYIQLDAQVRASGFYEKLGYRQIGEEHLDEYCPHIMMEKLL